MEAAAAARGTGDDVTRLILRTQIKLAVRNYWRGRAAVQSAAGSAITRCMQN